MTESTDNTCDSENESYDSTLDTLRHMRRVRDLIDDCIIELTRRGRNHDNSKLDPLEKDAFDRETPKLKTLVYGSDGYKASLAALGPALRHHYDHNDHHPEHFADGINGMDLIQVLEMTCDWIASAERGPRGSVDMEMNASRFGLHAQLVGMINRTIQRLKPEVKV